jgi:RNA polymerase sigma-70 factor (ECF subfamily)
MSRVEQAIPLPELYRTHRGKVRAFIFGMVRGEWMAEDLTQETFVRVLRNEGALKDPAKISSWIFTIANHLCQDHFRDKRKSTMKPEEVPERSTEIPLVSIQKKVEQHQMTGCVRQHMDLLPESLKSVLVLYDVLDFTHKEIAEILQITIENVKVRLHRARTKLKGILETKCHFESDERNVLVCVPR